MVALHFKLVVFFLPGLPSFLCSPKVNVLEVRLVVRLRQHLLRMLGKGKDCGLGATGRVFVRIEGALTCL